jgi:integrase/recombinase XerD
MRIKGQITKRGKRKERKLPVFLNEEERIALLKQPNPRYFTGERNKLLMQFMLDSGARISEAVNLKWDHVNLMSGSILIKQGKNSKDRYIWIRSILLDDMRKWRERQIKKLGLIEYVFTTGKGSQMGQRYIQVMVKRYGKKAGLIKDITPHKLRHTFATDFYKRTKDILKTGKALGHADVSTTMIYTHVVDADLEDSMKNFRD